MFSIFAQIDPPAALRAATADLDLHWHLAPPPTQEMGHCGLDAAGNLYVQPDWRDEAPPLLWPGPLPAEARVLAGLVHLEAGRWEAAAAAWTDLPVLLAHLAQLRWLVWGQDTAAAVAPLPTVAFEAYRQAHNQAVSQHYAPRHPGEARPEAIEGAYAQALELAPSSDLWAFTLRQWGTWLLDMGQEARLAEMLAPLDPDSLSAPAYYALLRLRAQAGLATLQVPYDLALLDQLKTDLRACVAYYQSIDRPVETGLLLLDAAQVAHVEQHFAEALGYANKAQSLLQDEGADLLGQALLRKGTLLFTWAQNGQPQFAQAAISTFQEALKIFTQAQAPAIFADIHQHLGVLYAEMPAPPEKAALWAAISASSFREALAWFTPERDPYRYGMICNNYGNALTRYQGSDRADYYQKALDFYREALSVRSPDFPYERALTLLNFLEASWKAGNPEGFNHERYEDMRAKAVEVLTLVHEPDLQAEAQAHLALLDKLIATAS